MLLGCLKLVDVYKRQYDYYLEKKELQTWKCCDLYFSPELHMWEIMFHVDTDRRFYVTKFLQTWTDMLTETTGNVYKVLTLSSLEISVFLHISFLLCTLLSCWLLPNDSYPYVSIALCITLFKFHFIYHATRLLLNP